MWSIILEEHSSRKSQFSTLGSMQFLCDNVSTARTASYNTLSPSSCFTGKSLSQQQQQWEPSVYNQYPMNLRGINPRCLKQSMEERRQETFQGKERKWCRPGEERERYNSWWTKQQVKRKKGKDYRVYRDDQSMNIEG